MKKWKHRHWLMVILFSAIVILGSCGGNEMEVSGDKITDVKEFSSTNEIQFLEEVDKRQQESFSDGDELMSFHK